MKNSASIRNPSLKPLGILVGTWRIVGEHPLMPGVELGGSVTFEWFEGGAFLRMYAEVDNPKFPAGIAIFGSDNDSGHIFMLYFDEREVSRKYECSITSNEWKWWRDDPHFSQRFTVKISEDGNTMVSSGEMRRDGSAWEDDLNLTYYRVK
jgi:hypothetical protein